MGIRKFGFVMFSSLSLVIAAAVAPASISFADDTVSEPIVPISEPIYTIQEQPVSSPVVAKPIQLPLKAGSTVITPAAKVVLSKTVASVISSGKPVSIAVSSAGSTTAKAKAQAAAIVSALKKLGVVATTKVTTVAGKSVVTVVVSKKKN